MASIEKRGRKPVSTIVAPGGGSVEVRTPFQPPTAFWRRRCRSSRFTPAAGRQPALIEPASRRGADDPETGGPAQGPAEVGVGPLHAVADDEEGRAEGDPARDGDHRKDSPHGLLADAPEVEESGDADHRL